LGLEDEIAKLGYPSSICLELWSWSWGPTENGSRSPQIHETVSRTRLFSRSWYVLKLWPIGCATHVCFKYFIPFTHLLISASIRTVANNSVLTQTCCKTES
jgi:hypothetical protein